MPGPVVNGVRQIGALGQGPSDSSAEETVLPLMSEGRIRLLLLSSGEVLMARLRNTTDRDGDHAYQLIRPRLVRRSSSQVLVPEVCDHPSYDQEPRSHNARRRLQT